MEMAKKFVAELIGTAALVLFGCGTAVAVGCEIGGAGYLCTAIAFGLAVVAMAYSVGQASGAHLNPAVSLAMLVSGRMGIVDFALYLVAQLAGAFVGVAGILAVTGDKSSLGANALADGVGACQGFALEAILTFLFVLVICAVTSKPEFSRMAGLVIGLTLTAVHLVGIAYTGTGVNPARSLAPAIVSGATADLWVFLAAPLVGGALAGLCWKFLGGKD